MTEDVDLQPGRIRETPREPLYKRRNAGLEPLEDDGLFPPAEPYEPADAIDDTSVDIFYLLDRLEELVSLGKRVPFYGKVMVEENEFLALVDQLRIAVPNEIKQAQRVIRERQTIIAESHEEAARILDVSSQACRIFRLAGRHSERGAPKGGDPAGRARQAQSRHGRDRRVRARAIRQGRGGDADGLSLIDESLERRSRSCARPARTSAGRKSRSRTGFGGRFDKPFQDRHGIIPFSGPPRSKKDTPQLRNNSSDAFPSSARSACSRSCSMGATVTDTGSQTGCRPLMAALPRQLPAGIGPCISHRVQPSCCHRRDRHRDHRPGSPRSGSGTSTRRYCHWFRSWSEHCCCNQAWAHGRSSIHSRRRCSPCTLASRLSPLPASSSSCA